MHHKERSLMAQANEQAKIQNTVRQTALKEIELAEKNEVRRGRKEMLALAFNKLICTKISLCVTLINLIILLKIKDRDMQEEQDIINRYRGVSPNDAKENNEEPAEEQTTNRNYRRKSNRS